jgi:hypothetical protein
MVWYDSTNGVHLFIEERVADNMPYWDLFDGDIEYHFGNPPSWSTLGVICYTLFSQEHNADQWQDGVFFDLDEW